MGNSNRIYERKILSLLQNEQFIIPYFQRDYDWNKENVEELIRDLLEFQKNRNNGKSSKSYRLGGMSWTQPKKITDLKGINKYSSILLIDGQQRLTTILLILKAISIKTNIDIKKDYFFMDGVGKEQGEWKFIRTTGKGEELFEILKHPKQFEFSQFRESTYVSNYKVIHNYLEDEIIAENLYKALENTIITWIFYYSGENEHRVFEAINARGKKLEVMELVKNYLFSRTHKFPFNKVKDLEEIYCHNIETPLYNEKVKIRNDFFNHIINYKNPHWKEKDIYKRFKEAYDRDKISKTFEDLEGEIKKIIHYTILFLRIFSSPSGEYREVKDIKAAKFHFYKSFLPKKTNLINLYIQLSELNTKLELNDNGIFQLVWSGLLSEYEIYEFITKYYIFRSIIDEGDLNKSNVAKIVEALHNKNKAMSMKDLIDFLNNLGNNFKLPGLEEVILKMQDINAHPITTPILIKLILLAVELNLQENYNVPPKFYNASSYDIEHIFPKTSDKWRSEFEEQRRSAYYYYFDQQKELIANLTILPRDLDVSNISESLFPEKVKTISSLSNLQINKMPLNFKKYDKYFLQERLKFIIKNFKEFFNIKSSSEFRE